MLVGTTEVSFKKSLFYGLFSTFPTDTLSAITPIKNSSAALVGRLEPNCHILFQ